MEDLKEIFAQKGFSLCFSSASVALYHALQCRRWKTGALVVTSRWESWLEKSRRCLASLPLQNLGLSLMALLVYSAQQLQPPPHQRTKRNLVFSKPCSPCSSLLPPQPPPQHLPPPNVAAFWEVGSLVVPAMTRPPPPQLLQPPPPPPPPPNVEVLLEGDFFAKNAPFFCRTTYVLDAKLNTICKVEEPFSEENTKKSIAHWGKILEPYF